MLPSAAKCYKSIRLEVTSAKDASNAPLDDIQMRPGLACQHLLLDNTSWQMVLAPEGL